MEVKNLPGMVMALVMIGLLLAVGILMYSKMNQAIAVSTTVTNEQITVTSGVSYLSKVDQGITAVSDFYNATNRTQNNPTLTTANWTVDGVLALGVRNGLYNVSYTYDQNTTATETLTDGIEALSPIASDWLPLIVTVMVLAIIIGIVLGSFSRYTNR